MKTKLWPAVLLVLAACAPSVRWLREDIHPRAVTGDRRLDRVKIWSGDSLAEWRDVLVTSDSISGIPYARSGCESCRRALPVSAVDSLSVGYDRNAIAKTDGKGGTPVWLPLAILAFLLSP